MCDEFIVSRRLQFLHINKRTAELCWVPYLTHTNDLDYEKWPLFYEDILGNRATRPRDPNKETERRLHAEFVKSFKPITRLVDIST